MPQRPTTPVRPDPVALRIAEEARNLDGAQDAISSFLASPGDITGITELRSAFGKLTLEQLRGLDDRIPLGSGRTAVKCDRIRSVLRSVLGGKT